MFTFKLVNINFFLVLLLFVIPKESIQRKITYDNNSQYTFYVVHNPDHNVMVKRHKEYHWYRDRQIHKTKGTFSGELLHGKYEQHSRDFDLKENGRFFLGLKDSIWNTYGDDGSLTKRVQFEKGLLQGDYKTFKNNKLLISGTYRNGKKRGRWINHIKNDTLYYYGDLEPQTSKRDNWITRQWKKIFKSKKNDSILTPVDTIRRKDSIQTKKVDSLKSKRKVRRATKKKKPKYEIRTVNGRKRRYKKND